MQYPCFLCLWDSRADALHYQHKDWPGRGELVPGEYSVKQPPLVDHSRILLPPLHIQLGLMKSFVKALDQEGQAYKYLVEQFPDAKMKAGVFIGPQIRQLLKNDEFTSKMVGLEKRAWEAFSLVVSDFLGKLQVG